MNSEEAAAYLAISPITLRRLVKTGKLPHVRLRTSLRFKISDLDTWLEKNTTREYVPVPGRGFQRKAAKV
jgi:excisionase family DNA binding protein